MGFIPVGLQLYTLRDECDKDFKQTLKTVSEIGYKYVELAGNLGGMSPSELKDFLGGLNIRAISAHVPIEAIEADMQAEIDKALEVGCEFIVCPYLGDNWRENAAGYQKVASLLTEAGRVCKDNGLQMCYHNHAFEFDVFDGKTGFDILIEKSDASFLQFELDTYWVRYANVEPIDFIDKLSGRIPLLHIKDMADNQERRFAEIGNGILNFPDIIESALKAGCKYFIVEQDSCSKPPIESVKISYNNLKNMGFVQ
ncbi:MAG: sugar phosphate isomerase/epimerase [Armatimonadota bacterium]